MATQADLTAAQKALQITTQKAAQGSVAQTDVAAAQRLVDYYTKALSSTPPAPAKVTRTAYDSTGKAVTLPAMTDAEAQTYVQANSLSFANTNLFPSLAAPSNVVSSNNIQPVTENPYVSPKDVPIPQVANLNSDISQFTPATLSPEQQKAQGMTNDLQTLIDQLAGKSAYKTQMETQYNIPELTKTQNDLTTQLQGIKNEQAQIPLQLQQNAAERGVTTVQLGRQENSRLRTSAIAALGVSTLLEASRGNLQTASDMVTRAVDARFGPLEEEINAKMQNLQLIMQSPQFTLDEKNQAAKMQQQLTQQAQQLADQKEEQSQVWNIATTAATNIANFIPSQQYQTAAVALNAIQNSPTKEAALQIAATTGLMQSGTAASDAGFTLSEGQTRYDALGKIIATAPSGEVPTIDVTNLSQQLLSSRGTDGYVDPGIYQQLKTSSGNPTEFDSNFASYLSPQERTNLGISTTQPITTLNGKPLTDAQSLSLGYVQRMNDANATITELGSKMTGILSNISGLKWFPNALKSDERQQYEQAERNFVNAVLRRESGAAISPSEFDSAAKQYFPQPGDGQPVIEQKTQNRLRVISSMAQTANVSLQSITGSQPNTSIGGTYEDYLNAIK
jgi:hypothetical protein